MSYTRREFGKLAIAGLPAAAVLGSSESIFGAFAQAAKPNSVFNGVQIGTITYSYRSMPDQSAEATLKYILDSGISAVEMMGGPVESFAGAPTPDRGAAAAPAAPAEGAAAADAGGRGGRDADRRFRRERKQAPGTAVTCVIPEAGARRWRRREAVAIPPSRRPSSSPRRPAQQEQAKKLKEWRTTVSMEPFKKLRKMYNDAGVSIYAWKRSVRTCRTRSSSTSSTWPRRSAATHTTLELPAGENAAAQLKRIGDFAVKKKIYAAYHTHAQGSMTAFDQAFAISKGNMANVDFGHWVCGRQRRRNPDAVPAEASRSDLELPSERSDDARSTAR